MTFIVTVAARANPQVKGLRGKAKDKFWDAVDRLEHEGCAAGHYRMRAPDGGDAHICGLRFYAEWRISKSSRADALFFSGRVKEAETILRELAAPERSAADRAIGLENLGRVLLAQSRYQEARQSFEAAARFVPIRSVAFSGLAELRLLQGMGPELALRDAERALQCYRNSLIEHTARERLAAIRGTQAWALAVLGHAAESQQAIDAGEREMDPKFTPEVAGFYWRAGMAMLALEDATAATGHFRRAAKLDPQGYYGSLAAQHLG